ncbi:MAG: M23 family peptidase [Acidobacteria bacterium]|nr:MAG: M23 family peptidase [Acidobacteriota bacterium]REK10102.1 MAG: M23 family peptidase [Acidobacteriota bacterium]
MRQILSLLFFGLFAACTLLALLLGGQTGERVAVDSTTRPESVTALGRTDALPAAQLAQLAPPERHAMRSGQSLVGWLLEGVGLDRRQANDIAAAMARHIDPRRLQAGTELALYRDAQQRPSRLLLPLDGRGELRLVRDRAWQGQFREYERRTRTHHVAGTVHGGFEAAVVEAGGPALLAYAIADVLQWDIDFNRDLREGDTFSAVYEAVWVGGRVREISDVSAVRFVNRDQPVVAYRFEDLGYYDADGKPLRKQFLRSPLPYSRVTSRFSNRRFHPVLKVYRPHHGVDYGAPTGTPVRVTANGVVASAAWTNGGGKTVKVRHANGYLTAYLHLSGYAQGIRAGARVRQGDVIGFVGSTGLSTAPHLDYRVQRAGRWIDPLQLPNEPAEPLAPEEMRRFQQHRALLEAELDEAAGLAGREIATAAS